MNLKHKSEISKAPTRITDCVSNTTPEVWILEPCTSPKAQRQNLASTLKIKPDILVPEAMTQDICLCDNVFRSLDRCIDKVGFRDSVICSTFSLQGATPMCVCVTFYQCLRMFSGQ